MVVMTWHLDPRALVPAILTAGIAVWRLAPPGEAVLALVLMYLTLKAGGVRFLISFSRGALLFVLYWGMMSYLAALTAGIPAATALTDALHLCFRTYLALLLGAYLSVRLGARGLALALGWYLRPFGRSSWQAALGMALMLRMVPDTLKALRHCYDTARLRLPRHSFFTRISYTVLSLMRGIGSRAEVAAISVMARGVTEPDMWCDSTPVPKLHFVISFFIVAGEILLFAL